MPATLYPAQLPLDSPAGQWVLRERLGAIDGIHVIQDCPWEFLNNQGQEEQNGADCLILAPGQGVLVLMLCAGRQKQSGQKEEAPLAMLATPEGAMARAKEARDSLQRFLSRMAPAIAGDDSGQASRCAMTYGVVLLPDDPAVDPGSAAWIIEAERFLDGAVLDNLGAAIAALFALNGPSPEFSENDIQQLLGQLVQRTQIQKPLQKPLKDKMAQAKSALMTLTQEQVEILQSIKRNRRAVILGGAGTGKTVLATEKARELAKAGFNTLFLCFNKPLQEHLAAALKGAGVRVQTFHGLIRHQAGMAGMAFPSEEERPQDWFKTEAPLLLAMAAQKNGERFNALIIDETQDFSMGWIKVLCNNLLTRDGLLYHFADSHQNLYQEGWAVPQGFPIFELTINCRNTRPIARRVARIFEDPWNESSMQVKRLPDGPQPEFQHMTDAQMIFHVTSLAETLLKDDGLSPEQLIVLTNDTDIRKGLLTQQVDGIPFTYLDNKGGIPVETVHRFKGLERDAVIMAMDIIGWNENTLRALSYVGMSRARSVLYVLADQKLKEIIHWDGPSGE